MANFKPLKLYKGCHHLDSPLEITIGSGAGETPVDTFVKVGGVWSNGDFNQLGFDYDGTGKITFNGKDGSLILFNGVSDLKVRLQAEITYALYKNGVLVSNAQTVHTFTAVSKLSNISITNILEMNKHDYYEVYVKSDTATTITINTLFLTFMGD